MGNTCRPMRNPTHWLAVVALMASLSPTLLHAQAPGTVPELVDAVVAVSGDSIVLQSEVRERMLQLQAGGVELPDDPAAILQLQDEIVNTLINEQLLLQAALRDSTIQVTDEQLEDIVTQDLDDRIRNVGGQQQLQELLSEQGMNLTSFREVLKEQARRQQLQTQYVTKRRQSIGAIIVTDTEVRAFIDAQRDQLPRRPGSISFRQVLVQPTPSDSAKAAAKVEAERILALVQEGGDFEELARRFSQDPGSAQQGGDLGWFRRGRMVPEFEDAAFRLRQGEISATVESAFGAHIIQVDRIRAAERKARHILIRAETNDGDIGRARVLADSIRARAEGGEAMEDLHEEFGDPAQPDSLEVFSDQLQGLPPGYPAALGAASPGEVIGPIEFGEGPATVLAVVYVIATRPEGEYTFEDLRLRVETQLQQDKILDRIVEELRSKAYVDVRE